MAAQAFLYGGMAALELAGGYFAAQNIRATAALNKDIADMNAKYAELDAFDAIAEGESEKARYQKVIDATMNQGQLNLAASGQDINYGTNAALTAENKFISQMNLMEIEKHAQEKSLGFKTQARQFTMSGAMQMNEANAKAKQVMFQSAIGTAKTSLSGYRAAGGPGFDELKKDAEDYAFANSDFSIA